MMTNASGQSLTGESRRAVHPFDFNQVKLLEGPFLHAQELDRKYLLSLEPARLLYAFRVNAGLEPHAVPYGGWESPDCEVRGHFVGHYLTACALMFRSTGDKQLKNNAFEVIRGLAECQDRFPDGYLSAFPEEFIERVINRVPVWAPWYTLHKIYNGLLDQYKLCESGQALEVLEKAVGWAGNRLSSLTEEQMQKMLDTEHGGMNELLANLYAITGKERYLELSMKFNHQAIIDPAINGTDNLDGKHANTQFPKILGLSRQYEITGNENFRKGAEFFWNTVVKERSYCIGGNSDWEMFSDKKKLSRALGKRTTETCNTYNMLKLTGYLFQWDPKAGYADYYERALYNHILASQNPETGMMCYYVPLKTGCGKETDKEFGFSDPDNSFWCCVGTGVENHAKYGGSIYFHNEKELFVNLFIASELKWNEKGISIRQETKFPDEQSSRLIIIADRPAELSVNIRYPFWALNGIAIKINGQNQPVQGNPGSFVSVSRQWETGDTIEISMPFSLRFESFRDDPDRAAVMYGPLAMCALTKPGSDISFIRGEKSKVLSSLRMTGTFPYVFTGPSDVFCVSKGRSDSVTTFLPFNKVYRNACAVYFDIYNDTQWAAHESRIIADKKAENDVRRRTVDRVDINDQSEKEHKFRGYSSGTGDYPGRMGRYASPQGWFQYELRVMPDLPQVLRCTYFGSTNEGRIFDILINGHKIAKETIISETPDEFYEKEYLIPEDLVKKDSQITVRFQASYRTLTADVFGCAVVRADTLGGKY